MSDTAVNPQVLAHLSPEALRYDLAKVRAQLEYHGAFRAGRLRPIDGVPEKLVAQFEGLTTEYARRALASAA